MIFTTLARFFFRAFTRITSTMWIITVHIIAIYAYHFLLLIPNRVRCIFGTDSVYTLLFAPPLYVRHRNHLSEQQISITDSHNANHVHNFYIWSFNFLEILFIKDTDANCNVITYRTSKLFLF